MTVEDVKQINLRPPHASSIHGPSPLHDWGQSGVEILWFRFFLEPGPESDSWAERPEMDLFGSWPFFHLIQCWIWINHAIQIHVVIWIHHWILSAYHKWSLTFHCFWVVVSVYSSIYYINGNRKADNPNFWNLYPRWNRVFIHFWIWSGFRSKKIWCNNVLEPNSSKCLTLRKSRSRSRIRAWNRNISSRENDRARSHSTLQSARHSVSEMGNSKIEKFWFYYKFCFISL